MKIDLSTIISMEKYKTLIETSKFQYIAIVSKLCCPKWKKAYDTIISNGSTHDDYLRYLFKTLPTLSYKCFVGLIGTL